MAFLSAVRVVFSWRFFAFNKFFNAKVAKFYAENGKVGHLHCRR
jgi:hypothetical protein